MRPRRASTFLVAVLAVLAGIGAVPATGGTTASAATTATTYLSDLTPTSVKNGLGPMERDRHNGGSAAGDGGPIVLNGRSYPKGLGTNAFAQVTYSLGGRYTSFSVDVGIDDSCGNAGSATAEIHTETGAVKVTGVLRATSSVQTLTVNVTGKSTLKLVVSAAGDGNTCDRLDWADARLTGPTSSTSTTSAPATSTSPTTTGPATSSTTTPPPTTAPPADTTYLSSLTPLSAKNGLGPVERDRHNGGSAAGDGGPLVVGGTTYARGLGVYPRSSVTYNLGKQYSSFRAVFGIDDSCGNAGSVHIEVHRVIGTQDFAVVSSGTLTGASGPLNVNVDVRNGDKLILHVIDVASNGTCARSDWADARLTGVASSTSTTSATSAPTTTTRPPTTTTTPPTTTSTPATTTTAPPGGTSPFTFDNVTNAAGLGATATAYVHAAAWGEVNGDGKPDLFVGTFTHEERPDGLPPAPNRLFLSTPTGFQPSGQTVLEVSGRASGAVLADLDQDGDADLVVSNNRLQYGSNPPPQNLEPHRLYRNDGGTFVDVSAASGIQASEWNGRSVGLLDYDGDGLLDLYLLADSLLGEHTRVSRLFRNTGGLVFQDRTGAAGLPTNHASIGVAVGDANGDTWPDLVTSGGVTESGEYARTFLYVNNRNGTFRDATTANLAWTPRTNEDWTAGPAWGDLNGDDRLDLVVGDHYGSATTTNPVAPRVYLNTGNDAAGNPVLEELTGAGITPIPVRAPHVEIQDFDNDGRPDIYASVRLNGPGGLYVYRNNGTVSGRPSFTGPPAPEIPYYSAGGPTADYDGDGRLDVFLSGLRRFIPPTLMRNTTPGTGKWLNVKVRLGTNTFGIGSRVRIYRAGAVGQPDALLGTMEITTGNGFSSAQSPVAHFGLGANTAVDVEVVPPFGDPTIRRTGVAANQTVSLS